MAIYVGRGLDPALAKQVAEQLMAHDALGAHARDELGISETLRARPLQAAVASALTFAVGAVGAADRRAAGPRRRSRSLSPGRPWCLAVLGGLGAARRRRGLSRGPPASPSGARSPWPPLQQ